MARLSRADRIAVAALDLVILLLIASLGVAFVCLANPRTLDRDEVPLLYTVRFPLVREEYTADIRPGDRAMDAVSKRGLGEVVAYEIAPAMTDSYDRTARRLRRVPYPGHVTLTLTIRASGGPITGGYSLDGFALFRGESIHLRLPSFVGSGTCASIMTDEAL